ncbi:MAG TPA: TetR/AcrR family transcriptional regulator [Candidatus Limnocylindrales bacterium]|nr:TetR/AcrR family transcriptional regulator [Candidatus Limnocylindrales bacterium]
MPATGNRRGRAAGSRQNNDDGRADAARADSGRADAGRAGAVRAAGKSGSTARTAKTGDAPALSGTRSRTRAHLLEAATRVFARKSVGEAAISEIAAEAGVANGTFYNYFRTREEVLEAVSVRLAERLHDDITADSVGVTDPAERVAVGARRFILQARRDPQWGAALLRVWSTSGRIAPQAAEPVLADVRAARRAGRFSFRSETAALDVLQGAVIAGIRSVVDGHAGEAHASDVAALILRALGVGAGEAEEIARRPLPDADAAAAPAAGALAPAAANRGGASRRRSSKTKGAP